MLTNEQIDQLFTFCEKHFVRHYDVKVELVDHLANAIEERMTKDKNLSFESALTGVHADFGVLGFAGIVNSHSRSLHNRYRKMRNRIFWSYFTWPKAAMTACIFCGFIFLRQTLPVTVSSYVGAGSFVCLWLFELFVLINSYYLQKKASQTLLMMQASAQEPFFIGAISGSFIMFFDWTDMIELFMRGNPAWFYAFTILLILFFVGILAYRQVIMETYHTAKKQYPQIFEIAG